MRFSGRTLKALVILVILVMLNACATTKTVSTQQQNILWPSAPAKAKIQYLSSFSGPDDVGIGRGVWQWLSDFFTGKETHRLIRPMSVVVTTNHQIYVADPGAGGVHRFDVEAGRYELITRANDNSLPSPVALALGPDNSVYVVDSELANIFQIQSSKSTVQRILPQSNLQQPTGIAYEPKTQRIYIADTARHQIKVFDMDGKLDNTFGKRGTAETEFNFPTYLWLDTGGRLFVTDSLNFRIQIFDGEGKFLNKFGKAGDGSGNLSRPKGVAVNKSGHIFVVDGLFNAVQIFNEQGALLLPVGSRGHKAGEFWLPAGIFVKGNEIFIADSHNQRVQVLMYLEETP